MTVLAGTRLGPYEVLSPLGSGGMGEVWRARDTRLNREVAIKVLPLGFSSDAERLKRFEREARAASSLSHPNIVTIYEVALVNSTSFIAMELVAGKTLREAMSGGAMPLRKLLAIAPQIAEGLARAHEAGIVHRDLKPENVMVTKDGLVKVLDFGLAKLAYPEQDSGQTASAMTVSAVTRPGIAMGTAGYMSPEQASGHPVDFRSDQFSLGSMLYEMATGKQPFKRGTTAQTLAAIIQDEPEPVAAVNPRVPPPLRWVIEQCQAKEPRGRYAATDDLARDLARIRDHLSESSAAVGVSPASRRSRFGLAYALAALALLAGIGLGALLLRRTTTQQPTYHRLTFRLEPLGYARFAPDGQTIVYGADWRGGGANQLFSTRADSTESTPLPVREAEILSISSSGMMAIDFWRRSHTLGETSLAGGAPREIAEGVNGADWSPDGRLLAVTRMVEGRGRLELPIGKVLYETSSAFPRNPRFSRDGGSIAVVEGDGSIAVFDLAGKKTTLSRGLELILGIAWHPKTGELWFSARDRSVGSYDSLSLQAVSRSGRHRVILRLPAHITLQDISRDGRVLLTYSEYPERLTCLPPGAAKEVDLSWLDISSCADLSDDGTTILIDEWGSVGAAGAVYLRKTDGSPAVHLGEGRAAALSPDGKWAIAIPSSAEALLLLPTGAGDRKVLRQEGLTYGFAKWLPDGKHVLFSASAAGHAERLYVQDVAASVPRPLTPEGFQIGPVSPDGRLVATRGPDGRLMLYPIGGGEPKAVPGVGMDEAVIRWDATGEALFLAKKGGLGIELGVPPLRIDRFGLSSGSRELWKEITPPDPSNVIGMDVRLTPDGRSYAYSYLRELSTLYVVDGLR